MPHLRRGALADRPGGPVELQAGREMWMDMMIGE